MPVFGHLIDKNSRSSGRCFNHLASGESNSNGVCLKRIQVACFSATELVYKSLEICIPLADEPSDGCATILHDLFGFFTAIFFGSHDVQVPGLNSRRQGLAKFSAPNHRPPMSRHNGFGGSAASCLIDRSGLADPVAVYA